MDKKNYFWLFILSLIGCVAMSCTGKDAKTSDRTDSKDSVAAVDSTVNDKSSVPETVKVEPFNVGMILKMDTPNDEMPSFRPVTQVKAQLEPMGYTYEHIKKGKVVIVPDDVGDPLKVKADVDRFIKDGEIIEYASTPETAEWYVSFENKEEMAKFLDSAQAFGFKKTGSDSYNWQGNGNWSFLYMNVEGNTVIIGYGE